VAPRGIRVERRARLADSRFVNNACASVFVCDLCKKMNLSSDRGSEFENNIHVFHFLAHPLYAPSPRLRQQSATRPPATALAILRRDSAAARGGRGCRVILWGACINQFRSSARIDCFVFTN
jgi:hypothetical protein